LLLTRFFVQEGDLGGMQACLIHPGPILAVARYKALLCIVVTGRVWEADGTDVLPQLELLLEKEHRLVVHITHPIPSNLSHPVPLIQPADLSLAKVWMKNHLRHFSLLVLQHLIGQLCPSDVPVTTANLKLIWSLCKVANTVSCGEDGIASQE
jgi:hypothetical protein